MTKGCAGIVALARPDVCFVHYLYVSRTTSAVPQALKLLMWATQMWILAVWPSGFLAAKRSPKALRHRILASGMIAAPPLHARMAFFANVAEDFVPCDCGPVVFPPEPLVLPYWDDGRSLVFENRGVAAAGVVCSVCRHAPDLLVLGYLVEQGRQGRAITLPAGGEHNGSDVGFGFIHGQMNLAPLTSGHLACRLCKPFQLGVNQHRPTPLKRTVVHGTVRGLVAGGLRLAHPFRLIHWICNVKPQTIETCSNAVAGRWVGSPSLQNVLVGAGTVFFDALVEIYTTTPATNVSDIAAIDRNVLMETGSLQM